MHPGEISARRAAIGHEQRVANKHSITDLVGHAGWRMPRGKHGHSLHIADLIGLAISEKMIELATVAFKFSPGVKDFAENMLDCGDLS